jgi:hypothetical protein
VQRIHLPLQRRDILLRNGMAGLVAELGEGGIFQSLAESHQARQTQAREVFGQAVNGHRELDELLELAVRDITFPACAQDVEAVFDGVRWERGHCLQFKTDGCIISYHCPAGNAVRRAIRDSRQ